LRTSAIDTHSAVAAGNFVRRVSAFAQDVGDAGIEYLVNRGVMCAHVISTKDPSVQFAVFNAHLHAGPSADGIFQLDAVRDSHVRQLRRIVDQYLDDLVLPSRPALPFVVLGDFNIEAGSADSRHLMDVFKDCDDAGPHPPDLDDAGRESCLTNTGDNELAERFEKLRTNKSAGARLDFILLSKGDWAVETAEVLKPKAAFQGAGSELTDLSDHYAVMCSAELLR
jgi:endonuclease/exonuclease/phosphatase family metal-dependent hydrolase